jgi:hypothetical protein
VLKSNDPVSPPDVNIKLGISSSETENASETSAGLGCRRLPEAENFDAIKVSEWNASDDRLGAVRINEAELNICDEI